VHDPSRYGAPTQKLILYHDGLRHLKETSRMQSYHIALVTSADLPNLFGGEQLLLPALEALGMKVSICVWDAPELDWTKFDAIVIRCPWDYHEKLPAFLAWLQHLAQLQLKVVNDLATLRWNLNKNYLFELQNAGLALIPSICLKPDDQRSLDDLLVAMQTDEIVVKPVQSAGAWRTLRVQAGHTAKYENDFNQWRLEQDFLVQPFMPEIMQDGEWSLVFFDGAYSHALIKRAKPGDFRVQSDHGGSVEAMHATPELIAQAEKILQTLPSMPCYARVDGVIRDAQFLLMELELLEPELFLELAPHAATQLAQAIIRRIPV
jgi:glutathione synthase/RimK-type ligase-like ATP-grasp enzyme